MSIPLSVHASDILFEKQASNYESAQTIDNPEIIQLFIGRISAEREVDYYTFVPKKDAQIPIKLLIPLGEEHAGFNPLLEIFSKDFKDGQEVDSVSRDIVMPDNYQVLEAPRPRPEVTNIISDKTSDQKYLLARDIRLAVKHGARYYITIASFDNVTGPYALKVGYLEKTETALGGVIMDLLAIRGMKIYLTMLLLAILLIVAHYGKKYLLHLWTR